jgi:hypothetical protein
MPSSTYTGYVMWQRSGWTITVGILLRAQLAMINAQLQASGLEILDRDQLVAELETIEGTSDGGPLRGDGFLVSPPGEQPPERLRVTIEAEGSASRL